MPFVIVATPRGPETRKSFGLFAFDDSEVAALAAGAGGRASCARIFQYHYPGEGKIMMKEHYEKMLPGARLWTGDMEVKMDAIEQIRTQPSNFFRIDTAKRVKPCFLHSNHPWNAWNCTRASTGARTPFRHLCGYPAHPQDWRRLRVFVTHPRAVRTLST
jgi:hypothetical protein